MSIYRGTGSASTTTDQATIDEVTTQATNAANSATSAASSASSAASSASSASSSASTATSQASAASTSASNASASASTASTKAGEASGSALVATNASGTASSYATNAETAETGAVAARAAAESAQTAAETAQTAAETAETNVNATINAAVATATAASATSASEAATSATNAATSATNASTSETNAATSATNAETNANNASESASQSATSATSAAASAASAASALDNFDDRYLGAKSSDPALDNDGDALITGALYFNTTDGVMRIYTASGWIDASSSSVATMQKYKFTATNGQTVFSGADDDAETLSLTVGAEMVTLNGVVLEAGTDYTVTSSSITLASGATTSDELNVYAFGNFLVADTVSASTGGTFQAEVTFDGGAKFNDNDKAIFGVGSDLQIYHDSNNNSYIEELGSGSLLIRGDEIYLQSSTGENKLIGDTDGAVNLFYNGSAKLATTNTGIDVTGTVTADGLTVDRDTGSTPTVYINNSGSDSGDGVALKVQASQRGTGIGDASIFSVHNNSSEIFTVRNDGHVGIGTDSPVSKLSVKTADILSGSTDFATVGLSSVSAFSAFDKIATMLGGYDSAIFGAAIGFSYTNPGYDMVFATNDDLTGNPIERMRISSSGNVGINESTHIVSPLTISKGNVTGAGQWASSAIALNNPTNIGAYSQISFGYTTNTTNASAYIGYLSTNQGTNGYGDLVFGTRAVNTDTQPTERMRINSSGKVGIGQTVYAGGVHTGAYLALAGFSSTSTGNIPLECYTSSTATRYLASFSNPNTVVGSISTSGSATSYNTSSDYRLKENVVDMTGAVDRVKALNPSQFNFIADPDKTVDGFLAHEVSDVVPEAVTGTKDAMTTEEYEVTPAVLDDDGNVVTEAVVGTREVPDYQGIDQSKLVPLLTGALQEAIARIETLEAQVATLQGTNT